MAQRSVWRAPQEYPYRCRGLRHEPPGVPSAVPSRETIEFACEFNCFPRRNGGRDARGFVSQSTTPVWVFLWSTPDRSLSHSSPPKKPRERALGFGSVKASSRKTMAL